MVGKNEDESHLVTSYDYLFPVEALKPLSSGFIGFLRNFGNRDASDQHFRVTSSTVQNILQGGSSTSTRDTNRAVINAID